MIIKGGYLCRTSAKYPCNVIQTEYIILQSAQHHGQININKINFPKEQIGLKVRLKCELEIINELDK